MAPGAGLDDGGKVDDAGEAGHFTDGTPALESEADDALEVIGALRTPGEVGSSKD
jgi:hypothetical protein